MSLSPDFPNKLFTPDEYSVAFSQPYVITCVVSHQPVLKLNLFISAFLQSPKISSKCPCPFWLFPYSGLKVTEHSPWMMVLGHMTLWMNSRKQVLRCTSWRQLWSLARHSHHSHQVFSEEEGGWGGGDRQRRKDARSWSKASWNRGQEEENPGTDI